MAIVNMRNEEVLLGETFETLVKLAKDIQESKEPNPDLVEAYTKLLDIYFGIIYS